MPQRKQVVRFFFLIKNLIYSRHLIYSGTIYGAAYLVALMPGRDDRCGIHSIILEKWRVSYPPPPKKNLTGLEELPCYFPRLIGSYDEVVTYLRN